MPGVVWEVAKEGERGSCLIGRRVRIWWDGDRLWYEGVIIRWVYFASHIVVPCVSCSCQCCCTT